MTLKTSFINSSIIKYNIKRYWWVSALSFVVLFTATILRILFTDLEYYINYIKQSPEFWGRLLEDDAGLLILVPTVSVLIAVCVLRYLQSPKSATLMHSLPPKRLTLYLSTFISGAILFLVPVLLAAIILACLSLFTQFGTLFSAIHVLRWSGVFTLYGLAFYSFAMFIGVFTGSSIAQFAFTYIILALPLGILAICTELLDGWLFAFAAETASPVMETFLKLLPFHYPMAAADMYGKISAWQYILMGGYIVVSCLIGAFFYNKRNIEHSGDIVVFKVSKPIFLYGVTVCCALVGAVMIKGITDADKTSLLALIGFGLLGYIVAKILLLKSFRILKYYKGAFVFVCAAILFWASINFNLLGFGKSTPNHDEIESAYIGTYLNHGWLYNEAETHYGYPSQNAVFKEEENIKSLIALQQNAIDGVYPQKTRIKAHNSDFYKIYNFYYISYKTKGGRTITRQYVFKREDAHKLLSTSEAKDCMFTFLRVNKEDIDFIRVANEYNLGNQLTSFTVSKAEEKALLIDALIKDTDALSYDELFEYSQNVPVYVDFTLNIPGKKNSGSATMHINEKFTNTLAFLNENYPEFKTTITTTNYKPGQKQTSVEVLPTGEVITAAPIS